MSMVKKCIESLVVKACTDPNLFGRPIAGHGAIQSPGGSVLWNGISTGARPRNASSDWWFEDVSILRIDHFVRVITAIKVKGMRHELIGESIIHYATKWLPGLINETANFGDEARSNSNSNNSSGSNSGGSWKGRLHMIVAGNMDENSSLQAKDQRMIIERLKSTTLNHRRIVSLAATFLGF